MSADTPTFETLSVEPVDEHVTIVRLNRPDASNALNTQMGRDLVRYFEDAALDPKSLRCIVLTGAGDKAFCAGGDLKERRGMTDEAWTRQHVIFERMVRALIDCPVPIIGAVNGAAYGGGCEIAGCCDFLYAAEGARFALTEVTLGIMPGGGGTQTLPRAVGERRAKELILTGKPFTAAEAHAWGLVNEVFPLSELLPAALATASRIARNAPISVRQAKLSIHRGLQLSLRDGLALEIEAYNRMVPTEDRREGVLAFNEKRHAQFQGTVETTAQSNRLGVWFTAAPSIASIFNFVTTPPLAEKPPGLLPAASTRWHGTTIGQGLRPSAWPTSRDSSTPPSFLAISP